jgi:hypothetical protein
VSGSAGAGATGGMGQADYYVSPTGSDANPGTLSAPFQTITKARDVVRTVNTNMTEAIHVYLRGGNYAIGSTLAFGPQDSGTNGHRVIYQAYPGEKPLLSGATKVTGWTQHSGDIYKASLNRPTKLRNLYVNDSRAQMASKTVTCCSAAPTRCVATRAGCADARHLASEQGPDVEQRAARGPRCVAHAFLGR